MSDLRDLYQELIIDHGRKPRHYGELAAANHIKEGFNPLCGDKLIIFAQTKEGLIQDLKFTGSGCAISVASASLMSEAVIGKTIAEAQALFNQFHQVVTGRAEPEILNNLGKLKALAGVSEFPARVKCASLCWHTLVAALDSAPIVSNDKFLDEAPVSTE